MNEAEVHDDLTRYGPSFRTLGRALDYAGSLMPRYGRSKRHSRLVTETWLAASEDVDLLAVEWLATLAVVAIAQKTNETPRSVFERKFQAAPEDADWRVYYGDES